MISRLQGVVVEKQAPAVVVDIQGVGYEVLVPMSSFIGLPALNEKVVLYTEFIVREDSQTLYGFTNKRERQLFQILLKVNGVGAKMALGILSAMDADAFVACVRERDAAALVKLPGIGKKTAERLLIELQDRLKDWDLPAQLNSQSPVVETDAYQEEALAALLALGYKPAEANKSITAALKQASFTSSEELIRAALRN